MHTPMASEAILTVRIHSRAHAAAPDPTPAIGCSTFTGVAPCNCAEVYTWHDKDLEYYVGKWKDGVPHAIAPRIPHSHARRSQRMAVPEPAERRAPSTLDAKERRTASGRSESKEPLGA